MSRHVGLQRDAPNTPDRHSNGREKMQDNPAHDRREDGKRPAWWTRIVRATRIACEREPINGLRPPMISRPGEDPASVP